MMETPDKKWPPELEDPIKHLKLVTFLEEIDGLSYFYFMAEKRNNTGTLYNMRFFILMGDELLGYARSYDPKIKLPLRSRAKIPTLKTSIKIKDITHCKTIDQRTLSIQFSNPEIELETPPFWIIKFASAEATQSVLRQIDDMRNKIALRLRGKTGMYDGPNSISQFKKNVETAFDSGRKTDVIKIVPVIQNVVLQPENPQKGLQQQLPTPASPQKLSQVSQSTNFIQMTPQKVQIISSLSPDDIPTIRKSHNQFNISYQWLEKVRNTSYLEVHGEFEMMSGGVVRELVDKGEVGNREFPEFGVSVRFQGELEQEFENYKYFLSKTNNQRRVKIPLMSLVRYRGSLALVKLQIPGVQIQQQEKMLVLQQIAEECQVNISSIKMTVVMLSRQQNSQVRQSQIFQNLYITHLPNLLPIDPYLKPPYCLNIPSPSSTQQIIKAQQSSLKRIASKLSNGFQQFYTFDELNSLLSWYGLNKHYIPALIEKSESKFVRMKLLSLLVAEQESKKIMEEQNIIQIVKRLNEVVQRSWGERLKQLKKRIEFNQRQVIRGLLVHGLIYFCGLEVNYELLTQQMLKARNNIFKVGQNVIGFRTQLSEIRIFNNGMWQKVKDTLSKEEQGQGDFQHLIKLLNLQEQPVQIINWPQDQLHNKLRLFLTNFTAPPEIKQTSRSFSASLYSLVQGQQLQPSVGVWKLALAKIKWLFLNNIIQPAQQLCEKLMENIESWSDGRHPVLCQTLLTIARYSASILKYDEACEYFSNCLQIMKQISPLDHQQFANLHNQLALAHQRSRNYNESVQNYSKVLQYMQYLELANTVTFSEVQFRLSKVALCCEEYDLAKENALAAVQIYYENEEYEDEVVDCYDLLARIAEVSDPELYDNICSNCGQGLGELKNPQNLEKMMRIVLLPIFRSTLKPKEKQYLSNLLQQIPISKNGYPRSLSYLRNIISKSKFLPNLTSYLNAFSHLANEIQKSKKLQNWQGLDQESGQTGSHIQLLCLLQALLSVLGLNFLQGALQ